MRGRGGHRTARTHHPEVSDRDRFLFCFVFLGSLSTFLEDCRYHKANFQKKEEFLLDGYTDLKDGGSRALVKGAGVACGDHTALGDT